VETKIVATGDVLKNTADNVKGTIDLGISTGDPTAGDYTLAVVTFRAKRATQALSVSFHQARNQKDLSK